MKKILPLNALCAAFLLLLSITVKAQDIHFSQLFETPMLRNPALAGIFSGDLRLQGVYRSQWNTVTDAYQTTSLNGEWKLPVGQGDDFLTLGAQVLYDKAGSIALNSTHLLPGINYHKSLSSQRNMYLSMGFLFGYVQRSFDRSKMTTNNQFDGLNYNGGLSDGENFSSTSYSYFDGSAGLSLNSQIGNNENNNIYLGIACHHFNKAKNISFYSNNPLEMKTKWVGSAGIRVSMTDYSYFTLESDYTNQGTYNEFMIGSLYTWKLDQNDAPKYSLHAGAFLRWKDAIIPVVKLECRPLSIGVSYDANISALKTASRGRGGFEISLTYQRPVDPSRSFRDYSRCPQF